MTDLSTVQAPSIDSHTDWYIAYLFAVIALSGLTAAIMAIIKLSDSAIGDSAEFSKARNVWSPALKALLSPREIRRFENKLRYFASLWIIPAVMPKPPDSKGIIARSWYRSTQRRILEQTRRNQKQVNYASGSFSAGNSEAVINAGGIVAAAVLASLGKSIDEIKNSGNQDLDAMLTKHEQDPLLSRSQIPGPNVAPGLWEEIWKTFNSTKRAQPAHSDKAASILQPPDPAPSASKISSTPLGRSYEMTDSHVTPSASDDLTKPPQDFYQWFPAEIAPPAPNVYELGLVLGGTVSAGAYTAGVIDFLIEALDTWQRKKAADPATPSWSTKIKAISGTSGGGVIGAILGRAMPFQFPPIRKTSGAEDHMKNALYRTWVRELDIKGLLATDDIKSNGSLKSLLNSAPRTACANLIANYTDNFPGQQSVQRDYLENPLPLILTLANVDGIAYQFDAGSLGQAFLNHGDYVRMAVFRSYSDSARYAQRPDEFVINGSGTAPGNLPWKKYTDFALGTSAFPVGFPLQSLERPTSHLRYRPIVISDPHPIRPQIPNWNSMFPNSPIPSNYQFFSADGGVTDNEPIELCRQVIGGWVGNNNPSEGVRAFRGVLLVDPFADPADVWQNHSPALFSSSTRLINVWKNQARYDSRDLLLAADENCFSRFMITAQRGNIQGSKAIATASLSAFGGFLHEDFRRHDYLLGRQNCQDYLKNKLVLPINNPLFSDWIGSNPKEIGKWTVDDRGQPSLPIIPLCDQCAVKEEAIDYPKGAFDPQNGEFQELLKGRVAAIINNLGSEIEPNGIFKLPAKILLQIAELWDDRKICDYVTSYITQELKQHDLLS